MENRLQRTVHAGGRPGQIHARALSLLWWHQSERGDFARLAHCRLRTFRTGGRAVAASKKTSFASLVQSTLCLVSVVAPGRFARGMAERLQRNTPRLIYVAGCPSKLSGTNLRHLHSNDAISGCHKRVIVTLVCVYFTFMTSDVRLEYLGIHESLVMIVMSCPPSDTGCERHLVVESISSNLSVHLRSSSPARTW